MHPQMELLVTLHDLDLMIKEATDGAAREKELGFKIDTLDHLTKAQADVAKQVDKDILARYQKLKSRYGRPVVPVINGICCGCHIRMPTEQATKVGKNQSLSTCGNCGRFLYWLAE